MSIPFRKLTPQMIYLQGACNISPVFQITFQERLIPTFDALATFDGEVSGRQITSGEKTLSC